MIEVIVDGGVNSGECLQTSHAPEAEHGPFSSSKRQVRILCSIVQPTTGFLPSRSADLIECCAVGTQPVGHDHFGLSVLTHCFSEEFQRGFLVAALGNIAFQHLTLVINSTPEVVPLAADFDEDFVQVPPSATGFQALNPPLLDLGCEHWPEPLPSKSDSFVADIDPAFMQQVLDIAERKREPDIEHQGQANDLGAGLEVLEGGSFGHAT